MAQIDYFNFDLPVGAELGHEAAWDWVDSEVVLNDDLFTAASGSSNSVTGVLGHLVLTGKVATVSRTTNTNPRLVTGIKGSVVLTGAIAVVSRTVGTTITPVEATLSYTGKTASVNRTAHLVLTPTKGTVVLTGKLAVVSRTANNRVSSIAGRLTYSGKTATVSQAMPARVLFNASTGKLVLQITPFVVLEL